ncbi:DNA replication and repair protein RecF [Rhodovulum imhoffii]|uniref:DNA replication and repair protein RecF n=1 Tax=Rhodovulum imhoffii TaxID=365340 RepID=A0A2T5BRS4_9RHOB|nr:DNA replication/repair protein RecF [Rhodovulum imhoffii]MBK5933253.1 DNA replication/repair protein RecF [Rhodovulum imhoffii]PTN01988.1 DNA replication and repair protein RecF [Rhodovulum imhoffii]
MVRLALTELALVQFRSHAGARLSLDGRPVAIYGPNGAGKTNLLEAVSLLSPGRGLRRAPVGDLARQSAGVGWRIGAVLESCGQVHEIDSRADPDTPRRVEIDGKSAPQVALARIARILWLTPAMDRLWIESAEGRRRFLDRIAMSFTPAHAETALAYEKAMRERNRLLKDGVADRHWYGALEARMAEEGARLAANRRAALARIEAAQAGAETAFPQAALALAGPEGADLPDAEILAGIFARGRAADRAAGRTLSGPHRADMDATFVAKAVPARLCSTGEQKALLISLVLANARALAQDFGAPPLLLLDEVAAHLDAARRAALYAEIAALGAQAFLTGTGADLFTELAARAQYVAVSEQDGTSHVTQKDTP